MEPCGIFPEGRKKGLETSFPLQPPFLGLAAREDSSIAEAVDLLQVQEEKVKARMKVLALYHHGHSGSRSGTSSLCTRGKKHAEMDEHFYTLIKLDALITDPQGGLYAFLPQHQSGLSRALRLSPACLPSPLPWSPSVWFPARG